MGLAGDQLAYLLGGAVLKDGFVRHAHHLITETVKLLAGGAKVNNSETGLEGLGLKSHGAVVVGCAKHTTAS